jgi:hypothetical protein
MSRQIFDHFFNMINDLPSQAVKKTLDPECKTLKND